MKKILLLTATACLLVSCGPAKVVESAKIPYAIETVRVADLTKAATLQKSALMKAGTQVAITAQSSGRVGHVAVTAGSSVSAGETIAVIEDTYGTVSNSVAEATIALENAKLSLESTTLSLAQSVESARTAYERARRDADLSGIGMDSTAKSKAQIDYDTFVTSQEKTLAGFETTYNNQAQNLISFLSNVIDTTDTLVGVSDQKRNGNDGYEYLLGALDSAQKIVAEKAIFELLTYQRWQPDGSESLSVRIEELQKIYGIVNTVLQSVETLLIKSVTDSGTFNEPYRTAQRAIIDAYQSQYAGAMTWLTTFRNTADAFLATYESDRASRLAALNSSAETSADSLSLSEKAYETAKNTQNVTLAQLKKSVDAAAIRLSNAVSTQSRLIVTAPVSGTIGKILIDEGEEVMAGRAITDIVSRDAECDITVDTTTLDQLQIGTRVSVDYRGQTYPGQILSISPIADAGLNFSVKIGVNGDVSVFGDFATIHIPTSSSFPTLPITAVTVLSPGQGEIWVTQTSDTGELSVARKNVVLWHLWGSDIEITSALSPTDEVVLSDMKNYNPLDFVLEKKIVTQ